MDTRARVIEQPAPATTPAPVRPADEHLVTTLWRGAFIHATCALCAWDGPARRAGSSADRDAARHRRG